MRLDATKEYFGERPRLRKGFTSVDMLDGSEESHATRITGNRSLYRTLSCNTRALLSRDKKRYVRFLVEDAVIFAESLGVLVRLIEALHEEERPLGLQSFWPKDQGLGLWKLTG